MFEFNFEFNFVHLKITIMKKITLLLCLSIVGFMGYSQQSNQKLNNISTQENVLTIQIGNMDFKDAEDQDLLVANDFSDINFENINFENNTHELVHKSSNQNNLEYQLKEGAFSYNEYVLQFDFKSFTQKKLKY